MGVQIPLEPLLFVKKLTFCVKKVLPGLEPGSLDSKSRVITDYTIGPMENPGFDPGASRLQSAHSTD